jgi:hypothetical protein
MPDNENLQETFDVPLVCPKSPGYWYGSSTGIHALGCKSRQCEVCQKYWATRWRIALNFKAKYDNYQGMEAVEKCLTLTFAEPVDHEVAYSAHRYFWQLIRVRYPKIKYFKSMEVNQKHTQPHSHWLLQFAKNLHYKFVRICWIKAQGWAGIGLKAWNVNITDIEKNMAAYLTKYLTKAGKESKHEIPSKKLWRGRYVSYSPGFFARPLEDMLKIAQLHRQIETADQIDRVFILINKEDRYLESFTHQAQEEWNNQVEEVNYEWDYKKDNLYGVKVTLDISDIAEYNLIKMPESDRAILLSLTQLL